MRTLPTTLRLGAIAVAALALGCSSQDVTQPSSAGVSPTDPPPAIDAKRVGIEDFNPGNFVGTVDNPLFPLPLGRRLIYRGTGDGEPMRVVTDVTRQHKTILGVAVVVVLDRVFVGGELAELTYDWYAQDRHGNVWYLGEDTKEFEGGEVVSTAGSFEAGKNGARAGIIMRAHPKVGLTTPQESAPGVAEDRSRVVDKNVTVTVPYGTLRHCIKTEETTPLEPDVLENKWYCPGVGIARERDVRGGNVTTLLPTIVQR